MKKRVLVTGGAGFIGSHVTNLLCDLGYTVKVIDDLRFGYRSFVDPRATFIKASIGNKKALYKALSGVDVVMHLAASSIIKDSYAHPDEYFYNNVTNGIALLEAMRARKVKSVVFSSTSSVYGEQDRVPIPETATPNPIHPYATSKLAFEQALRAYYHAFGIESTTLRYYNVYGPRDDQRPRTRAIPMWIIASIKGKPVPWYWQGKQIRDYIYVKDVARAHVEVMGQKGLRCYNIGSGKGIRMNNVLAALEQIVGRKLSTVDLGERKGDTHVSFADISKIQKEVGWEPSYALKDGLQETLAYYRTHYA